jgi:hypothetical protein
MEKLYLITVRWEQLTPMPDTDKVENVLGPLGRWMRFSGWSWLLWTTRGSEEIYSALAPALTTGDTELIARIDENDWYGFAPPWVWTWIRSRGQSIE